MKSTNSYRVLPLLKFAAAFAAAALGTLHSSSAIGAPSGPIGDLTVTVQERTDGGVNFSMGGSTTYRDSTSFSNTPADYKGRKPAASPTAPDWESIDLPEGLQFLVDGTPVPVTRIYFASGLWYLEVNSADTWADVGTTISGTGMIEMPGVPYSHFEPGTETVEGYTFDMTYEVLPFVPSSPRLRVPRVRRFPATPVGRSSRRVAVRVASIGDAAANGIRVGLRGAGTRHFRATQTRTRRLFPGQTTIYSVVYRPRGAGRHRAAAIVSSNAPNVMTQLSGLSRRRAVPLPVRAPLSPRR